MAEADSLDSIARHGLLSTTALLDLFGVTEPQRTDIEARRRAGMVTLRHPIHGEARIRDNKPMYDAVLERTLVGFSVEEWYRLLNGKVFFWCSRERLARLRGAAAYRERQHLILEIDCGRLVASHLDAVTLSTMNSGATHPGAQYPRGTGTFEPLARYKWRERMKSHPSEPAVELAVEYGVSDIMECIVRHWIE